VGHRAPELAKLLLLADLALTNTQLEIEALVRAGRSVELRAYLYNLMTGAPPKAFRTTPATIQAEHDAEFPWTGPQGFAIPSKQVAP
jgi:hypothetical protein